MLGETSQRGMGQGREERREGMLLVTIVQWLGLPGGTKETISANSNELCDQAVSTFMDTLYMLEGPTVAMVTGDLGVLLAAWTAGPWGGDVEGP